MPVWDQINRFKSLSVDIYLRQFLVRINFRGAQAGKMLQASDTAAGLEFFEERAGEFDHFIRGCAERTRVKAVIEGGSFGRNNIDYRCEICIKAQDPNSLCYQPGKIPDVRSLAKLRRS